MIRYADFALDDDHVALRDTLRAALAKLCPFERVRSADGGHDPELWSQLVEMGIGSMALDTASDGSGAGVVELAIVMEELGRVLAPVPAAETAVARRALAALKAPREWLGPLPGDAVVTLADAGDRRLVAAGACAHVVLQPFGDGVRVLRGGSPARVQDLAGSPLAWWDVASVDDSETFADGNAVLAAAFRELRLLRAAQLVGVAATAVELGASYARERVAFGVPIGSFQAVAHPLADAFIATEGARRLVHKAAWFVDHEPAGAAPLVPMAALAATEAATAATGASMHVLGGVGFTLESDIHLYFRVAKLLQVLVGDAPTLLADIADARYGLATRVGR